MARVIRASHSGPTLIAGEVYDARRHAAELLAEARAQAESLRQTARADGHAAGYAAAAKELFEIAKLREAALQRLEQQALQAVLLVAAELLGTALTADPTHILTLLAPHLARIRRAAVISLKVHPQDAAWLERHADALRERAGLSGRLELQADPSIARGGCFIESSQGEVDARVETRLDELSRALGLHDESEGHG
jgi:flagellar assembly protein FliH